LGFSMRILVVDDQRVALDAVREALEWRGHVVVGEASDATVAIEMAARVSPDVVLVDVWLGEESGFDLVRALRVALPELPTVLMSMDPVPVEDVEASGARASVAKVDLLSVDLSSLVG